MFGKKCPRCNRKISKDYDFCPYCGVDFRNERRARKQQDFGLLGREDSIFENEIANMNTNLPFGFNKLFNSLLKEVDKQFQQLDKGMAEEKIEKLPNSSGISISISTGAGRNPEIKVDTFGDKFKNVQAQKPVRKKNPEISDEQARKISKLPRKEAEAQVRRLSNKVIYELFLPGVKSIKDIIINKLENSTEIKAFTDKTVYVKLLPVNFPLMNYRLENDKLILEFKP